MEPARKYARTMQKGGEPSESNMEPPRKYARTMQKGGLQLASGRHQLSLDGEVLTRDHSVTGEICRVLKDYPPGTQSLRELVQNADDARATCIKFLLTRSSGGGERKGSNYFLSPAFVPYSGPALYAYNDARFTESDFQAIRSMGASSKSQDITKTGKFGLGFNAVYHLTDLPTFVTGPHFVILDPQQRTLTGADGERAFARRWNFVDNSQLRQYTGHVAWFSELQDLSCSFEEEFSGTLFRFPLRAADQANESDLSKEVWNFDRMLEIFQQFSRECERLLLFLKSVKEVELLAESPDGRLEVIFKAMLTDGEGYFRAREQLSMMLHSVSKDGLRMATEKHEKELCCTATVAVHTHSKGEIEQCHTWLVASHVSVDDVLTFAEKHASEVPDSRFVPWVQLALPLSGCRDDFEGFLFCFLQLPIKTGLGAHVNGFFELSSNRRDLWYGDDLTGAEATKRDWNQHLLATLVPQCLLRGLAWLAGARNNSEIAIDPNSLWPAHLSPRFEALEENFYKYALAHSAPPVVLTPAGAQRMSECFWLDSSMPQVFVDALMSIKAPAVKLTDHVFNHIKKQGAQLMLPVHLRKWLRSAGDIPPEVVPVILKYCISDGNASDLEGCPLAWVRGGRVLRFNAKHKGDGFICCSSQAEWTLAKHFVNDSVLHFFPDDPDLGKMLLQAEKPHEQIRSLDVEVIGKYGKHVSGAAWADAFWQWHEQAKDPKAKLGPEEHPLDMLKVLRTTAGELVPLGMRRHAVRGADGILARGLAACGVLLVQDAVCESCTPDAVAKAVANASTTEITIPKKPDDEAMRAVLEKIARADASEAVQAGKKMPAFRMWGGEFGKANVGLFPCGFSDQLRESLRNIHLDALDEQDAKVVDLLRRMGIQDVDRTELVEAALKQTQELHVVASVLKEGNGLEKALRGKAFLPTQSGKLLAPEQCLAPSAHNEFAVSRRVAADPLLANLDAKLVDLGCRTELDEVDVIEIATHVEKGGNVKLAGQLLQHLDRHKQKSMLCKSSKLGKVCWLPTVANDFVAPSSVPWHIDAKPWVGKVRPLIDGPLDVLQRLGVRTPSHVDDAVLTEQLKALVTCPHGPEHVDPEDVGNVYRRFKAPPALEKWVWCQGGFVEVARMSKDPRAAQLEPEVYKLRDEWSKLPVFSGVAEKLLPEKLLRVLETCDHSVKVAAANMLAQEPTLKDTAMQLGVALKLPSASGKSVAAEKLFIRDMSWKTDSPPDMEEMHKDVTKTVAEAFGVRHLSEVIASECMVGGDWLEVTGQHEPLTVRLKNILKDYPWQTIVKEMLQNAEDAGATVFKVLVDWRQHGAEKLLTPEMAKWQGPSLWFYNDQVFREKDWSALVNIGQGSKGEEQGKIGRHGLGFNSIFNISDLPSILSQDSVLFLDPHVTHLSALGANSGQPGVRLKFSKKDLCATWPDQFKPYELQGCRLQDRDFKGTLIRAPLRQKSSDISDRCFSQEHVEELLDLMRSEMHLWLLFLRNVRTIEVEDVQSGQVLLSQTRTEPSEGHALIQNASDGPAFKYLTVTANDVSIAAPEGFQEDGRVFSRLPLDIVSGCVHISALFWTSADRRTLVIDETKDHRDWADQNRSFLKQACHCLCDLVARCASSEKRTPFHLFPDPSGASQVALHIREVFYSEFTQRVLKPTAKGLPLLFSACGEAVDGQMVLSTAEEPLPALRALHAPVVKMPPHVIKALTQMRPLTCCKEMTPSSLREWLRDKSNGVGVDKDILEFCLSDKQVRDLDGCPLALVTTGKVRRFGPPVQGDVLICCATDEEFSLAKHFPGDSVLTYIPALASLLQQHPQVQPLSVDLVASHGASVQCDSFAKAFWQWHQLVEPKNTAAKLCAEEHKLDQLQVLHVPDGRLLQLGNRRRAVRGVSGPLAQGLQACGVLLVNERACPDVCPDAIVNAISVASPNIVPSDPNVANESWREVLDKVARAETAERINVAKKLPAFKMWGGELVHANANSALFPMSISQELRKALKDVKFNALDEQDHVIVGLLEKMGCGNLTDLNVVEEALKTNTELELVVQVLRQGLGNALRGKPVIPTEGGGLLPPEECMSRNSETKFQLSRRVANKPQLNDLGGKLQDLGCRTEIDLLDVLEVADIVESKKDSKLASELLRRLEHHHKCQEFSKDHALCSKKWLRTSDGQLVAPNSHPWHSSAVALVGKVRPLVEGSRDVLKQFGVYMSPEDIDDTVLSEQLQYLIKSNATSKEVTEIYKHLKQPPSFSDWVWTQSGFVCMQLVSKDPEAAQLEPLVHKLRDEWTDLPVFASVGSKLLPATLFHALGKGTHDVRVKAASMLARLSALPDLAKQCKETLKLPSKSGQLVDADKLFVHDMAWKADAPNGMLEVHKDLSGTVFEAFGVRRLSQVVAGECMQGGSDWLEVTGQHEPLTIRLKNILKDYPWQSLVKEMLQNAEDAGASVFRVMIDQREHGRQSLLTSQMEKWQGPSLLFYNDSIFQEKDWKALVALGRGSKAEEKGKIGRHGLGFNSIFNITDLPSILSQDSVLFLDPHVVHLKDLGADSHKPGVRLNFSKKDLRATWPDQFKPYEVQGCCLSKRHFQGTLIRAPLRKEPSEISMKCFSNNDWEDLKQLMERDLHLWLLFLRNVKTIEVVDLQNGKLILSCGRTHPQPGRVLLTGSNYKRHYDIQAEDEVGVAAPNGFEEKGRLFSRLPLDIESGSVHMSALFWTSADRRNIIVDQAKDHEAWATENRQLLAKACRCLHILALRRASERKETPVEIFPISDGPSVVVSFIWSTFYQEVAQQMAAHQPGLFYTVAGLPAAGRYILVTEAQPPAALKELKAPVAKLPRKVIDGLQKYKHLFVEMSPKRLREWLRSDSAGAHCDEELLKYCVEDGDSQDLDGCPLAKVTTGEVRRFGSPEQEGVLICCEKKEEWTLAKMFPGNSVLCYMPELASRLVEHKQVKFLSVDLVVKHGLSVRELSFANAFWQWQQMAEVRDPAAQLSCQEHPFDKLHVLRTSGNELLPLGERQRAVRGVTGTLVQGLQACRVLLVNERVCPELCPDVVVKAIACASPHVIPSDSRVPEQSWRSVLEKVARAEIPEAKDVAQKLPAFKRWDGSLGHADSQLFPLSISDKLCTALKKVKLKALDEKEGVVVQLLRKMGCTEMEPLHVVEEALKQSTDLDMVVHVLNEGLGEALRGKAAVPTEGGKILPPHECLLRHCESAFPLSRRVANKPQLANLGGKLQELGCRMQMDIQDVVEVARVVEAKKDSKLGKQLLEWLDYNPQCQDAFCKNDMLLQAKWLKRHNASSGDFLAPKDRPWHVSTSTLVGKVRPIVEGSQDVLKALGVHVLEDIDDQVLSEQLQVLLKTHPKPSEVKPSEVGEIYKHLKAPPSFSPWIWTPKKIVDARHISKDPKAQQLEPLVHKLRDDWMDLPVFKDVSKKLDFAKLLEVLEDSNATHQLRVKVVCLLAELGDGTQIGEAAKNRGVALRVPSKSKGLVTADRAFLHDMAWKRDAPEGMEEVHADVPFAVAQKLGVRKLSKVMAGECMDEDNSWLEITGQHEPLTRRLKNILKDYPWQSLVKEMLQNAEDAGASTFRVLVDKRAHGRKSLLTSGMNLFQGTSLWFYNDSVFEEKDWKALVSLGHGSKVEEMGKIGRHGLGFNSIFNVTDLPSVLSQDSILFLDPHINHLCELGADDRRPGVRLNFLKKDLCAQWPDQFKPYEIQGCRLSKNTFSGTLIRAPLRCQPSEINKKIFGEAELRSLMDLMHNEAHLWLLFLRNIKVIELVDVKSEKVLLSWSRKELGPSRILIEGGKDKKPYDIITMEEASVAVPVDFQEEGRVFSRLPLELRSESVHMSALFWTSSDRRSIVVDSTKDHANWAAENQHMIKKICCCLCDLIALRAQNDQQTPFHIFPPSSAASQVVQKVWVSFFEEFVSRVARPANQQPALLYSIARQPLQGVRTLITSSKPMTILSSLEAPVVTMPEQVFDAAKKFSSELRELTPASLRSWLREESKKELCDAELLTYCLSDEAVQDLNDCPLAKVTNGSVRRFSASPGSDKFVCCQSEEEWKVAKHLKNNIILEYVPEASKVLMRHPQVYQLSLEVVAAYGESVKCRDFADAFWRWQNGKDTPQPANELRMDSHVLDKLHLLRAPNGELLPFHERRRSMRGAKGRLGKGLQACGVLLIEEAVCPEANNADDVARAVAHARSSITDARGADPEDLKAVLDKVARAEASEAVEAARAIPAFRHWDGKMGYADKPLFPRSVSRALRQILQDLKFEVLDEQDGVIVDLLTRMEVTEAEPHVIVEQALEQALEQTKRLDLVVRVLNDGQGLEDTLRGKAVVPTEGKTFLLPELCIARTAESDFPLSRRVADDPALNKFAGKLLDLGVRTEMNEEDACEVATRAAEGKDVTLGQRLLRRLEDLNHLCTSQQLRSICWLPTNCGTLVVPSSGGVWHDSACALVGKVKMLVTGKPDTLRLLGVLLPENANDGVLHEQLCALIKDKAEAKDVGLVYERLQAPPKLQEWIWTSSGFLSADDVSKDQRAGSLEPWVHRLRDDWMNFPVFRLLSTELSVERLLRVIQRLHDEQRAANGFDVLKRAVGWQYDWAKEAKIAITVLKFLFEAYERSGQREAPAWVERLLMPAQADSKLRKLEDLFIPDMTWLHAKEISGAFAIHRDIPFHHAMSFGVQRCSTRLMKELTTCPGGTALVNDPCLKDGLRLRLLQTQSSWSFVGLLEVVLNVAERAGASSFQVFADFRRYGSNSLLNPALQKWQGPSICLSFDAELLESDWQALLKLDEPWMALFWYTDLPSILSKDYICFLDPFETSLKTMAQGPALCMSTCRKGGDHLDKLWPDQFEPYRLAVGDKPLFSDSSKRTIIRIPVREGSNIFEQNRVPGFSEVVNLWPTWLLFTKHVRKLDMSYQLSDSKTTSLAASMDVCITDGAQAAPVGGESSQSEIEKRLVGLELDRAFFLDKYPDKSIDGAPLHHKADSSPSREEAAWLIGRSCRPSSEGVLSIAVPRAMPLYDPSPLRSPPPCVGILTPKAQQSPICIPGAHIHGLDNTTLKSFRKDLSTFPNDQNPQVRALAVVLVDVVLYLWAADRVMRGSLIPAMSCDVLAQLFTSRLLSCFQVEGSRLSECAPAPDSGFLKVRPQLRAFLAQRLHLVVVPPELKALLDANSQTKMLGVDVSRVLHEFLNLSQDLKRDAVTWLFRGALGDPAASFTTDLKNKLHILQREDGTFGAFSEFTWCCPDEEVRSIISLKSPSPRVVKNTEVSSRFDERLNVLDPKKFHHLAKSICDVAGKVFWKKYNEDFFKGEQLSVLEGKMPVKLKRAGNSSGELPLTQYGFICKGSKAVDALLAIGCCHALDEVPAPYAGNTLEHVAQHIGVLKSRGELQVESASAEHKGRLCEEYLEATSGLSDLGRRIFLELPIVKHGRDQFVPLARYSFVRSDKLAKAFAKLGLLVRSTSDSLYCASQSVLGSQLCSSAQLLCRLQAELVKLSLSSHQIVEILLAAIEASGSDGSELRNVFHCKILSGSRCISDLWHPEDILAKSLGAIDESLTKLTIAIATNDSMSGFLKCSQRSENLLELLRVKSPSTVLHSQGPEFTGHLLSVLNNMKPADVQNLQQQGFSKMNVIFAGGSWQQSCDVYLQEFASILYMCKVPCLKEKVADSVRELFAKRPSSELVAQQLEHLSTAALERPTWCTEPADRKPFIDVYKFLNKHVEPGSPEAVRLGGKRCILDRKGVLRLPRHFSLKLILDLGPLHVVAEDVKPFSHMLLALGAVEKGSDTPLPEPVRPSKMLEMLHNDVRFVDLTLLPSDGDGAIKGHCNVWCMASSKLHGMLKPCEGGWCLPEPLPGSLCALQVVKKFVYSGHVDDQQSEVINKLSLRDQQGVLEVATFLGIAYLAEWMRQFLHGATPDADEPEGSKSELPSHWRRSRNPAQGVELVRINPDSESDVFNKLARVLIPQNSAHLGVGRDHLGWQPYSRLNLVRAWRIQHPANWRKYDLERGTLIELHKNRLQSMPKPMLREGIVKATEGLPGKLHPEVNEVFLVHGTKPDSLLNILSDGLNERFSGGMFGNGTYLAEDPSKNDQYVSVDQKYSATSSLHKMLYSSSNPHPENVFYIILCRTLMGYFVRTRDGETSLDHPGKSIWASPGKREFSTIPDKNPPVTFHSLLVETGGRVHRHREIILTHSERIYPEYLLAYKRE